MNRSRAAAVLEREGLAAILACSPENVLYVTGFDCFQHAWNRVPRAALVSASGRGFVVLPMAEVGFAVDQRVDAGWDVYVYGAPNLILGAGLEPDEERIAAIVRARRFDDAASAATAALRDFGVKGRVAVDGSAFVGEPGGEQLLKEIRMVKTPEEIEKLRRAAALNERGIRAALSVVGSVPGTEVEAAHRAVVSAGGGAVQHWQGSAGRRAGAYRHPQPATAPRGSRWVYDTGIILDGYCSDLGGTVQVGAPPSAEERRIYDALTAAIDRAVELARPGVRPSELYAEALAAARAHGHPEYAYSMLGHGIGVEPRDLPLIAPGPFDPVLEAGMVLNFETPIIHLGVGGYQHEVTCVVAEGGGQLLSPRRAYEVV
ncbi:MAG TPA: M24 family metallopeptidase [Solirubrobacter sp.]|nr:M24 family metallopeptidase [Solirubrobacter sp.]